MVLIVREGKAKSRREWADRIERAPRMASFEDVVSGDRTHTCLITAKQHSFYRSEFISLSPKSTGQVLLACDRVPSRSSHAQFVLHLRVLVLLSVLDCFSISAHRNDILSNVGGEIADCTLNPRALLSRDPVLNPLN